MWVRYILKNTSSVSQIITFAVQRPKEHVYVLDNGKWKHFMAGDMVPWSKRNGIKQLNHIKYTLKAGEEIKVYLNLEQITLMTHIAPAIGSYLSVMEDNYLEKHTYSTDDVISFGFFGFILFAVIFNYFLLLR